MRTLAVLFLLPFVAAATPQRPDPETVRAGLLAPGREAREAAFQAVRDWGRTDPMGAAALWDGLDLRGRALLVEALASAGTSHAAALALARAAPAPEPEIFGALLQGLPRGGEKALFTAGPPDLPPARRDALEALRLRWRIESELVRLKSPSGPTGHYTGQYKRLSELGPGVVPVFLDLVEDRARPLPGEGGAGPYRPIHPGMVLFDPQELRSLAAYGFAELADPEDPETLRRLAELFHRYWDDPSGGRFEREQLAPALAFSLHDLGVRQPVRVYIADLTRRERVGWGIDQLEALWELGYAYIRIGEYERGQRYYEEYLEVAFSKAIAAYNLACSFSMQAKREPRKHLQDRFRNQALHYLERAVHEFSYGDWKWMEEDGDLDAIRDHPRYRAVLEQLRRRYPERAKGKVSKDPRDAGAPK